MGKDIPWVSAFKDWMELNIVTLDNVIFRLHYGFAVYVIFCSMLVYSLVSYWHGIISCMFPPKTLGCRKNFYSFACLTGNMYTVSNDGTNYTTIWEESYKSLDGIVIADMEFQKIQHLKYYNFIPFMLLLQILILNFPRYLWRCYEGGKVEMLCKKFIDYKKDQIQLEQVPKEVDMVAEYVVESLEFHDDYAFAHAFCELLNLGGVILQIYLIDGWSGHAFTKFGPYALEYSLFPRLEQPDPFENVFPTLAKCTVSTYGPSGNIIPHSGICTVPLNLVNKIYFTFMWVFLVVMIGLNVLNAMYRILTIVSFEIRKDIMEGWAFTNPKENIKELVRKCHYGDFFLLCLLAKNLDAPVFNAIVGDILSKLKLKINPPANIPSDHVVKEEKIEKDKKSDQQPESEE